MSEITTPHEPSSEPTASPELSPEPTGAQLAEACRSVLSSEDCGDIVAMEAEGLSPEEVEGFVFSLLIANGVEDPEAFLAEHGIFEPRDEAGGVSVPEVLGIVETPELAEAHVRLVEALLASQDATKLAEAYLIIAEAIVDGMDNYAKGQLALTIQLGLIAKEAGRMDMYAEYLEQARTYADNLGLDELVDIINGMISAV